MNPGVIAAIVYGIVAMVGGVLGYAKAKSIISLLAGGVLGLLLVLSGLLQWQGQSWGLILAVIVTTILIIAFIARLAKTRKFMPAGLMMLLGFPALSVMINQLLQ